MPSRPKTPSPVPLVMPWLYSQATPDAIPALTATFDGQTLEATSYSWQVPVVGNVAAGSPILAEECIEDYLTFDTGGRTGEYFALRVRGESMLGAGILPGDLVVVHQQESFINGDIVVALFEDEATVKTLRRKDGHIWLLPENPEFQPINGDCARLLGKVVAVVRQYS